MSEMVSLLSPLEGAPDGRTNTTTAHEHKQWRWKNEMLEESIRSTAPRAADKHVLASALPANDDDLRQGYCLLAENRECVLQVVHNLDDALHRTCFLSCHVADSF